ncbi:MAG TPA: CYTH domain-containing protein [Kofleriaceae bacterium]|jgi:adenylate cyclase|nr:CYTH domain-containing protein [Kofleriaceae bacterium]
MGSEIERKFLVAPAWRPPGEGVRFTQGYLSTVPERVVRVRLEGESAKLTIKGKTQGITRQELEYEIPASDAPALFALCEQPLIEKDRYRVEHDGKTWEVDVFHGDNEGLVVAELELASETEPFAVPPWAVEEVSHDPRYYNANLQRHPYRSWQR